MPCPCIGRWESFLIWQVGELPYIAGGRASLYGRWEIFPIWQVGELAASLSAHLTEIELVVVSPLTRALQTATGALAGSPAPFMLNGRLRERLGAPCDTVRPVQTEPTPLDQPRSVRHRETRAN